MSVSDRSVLKCCWHLVKLQEIEAHIIRHSLGKNKPDRVYGIERETRGCRMWSVLVWLSQQRIFSGNIDHPFSNFLWNMHADLKAPRRLFNFLLHSEALSREVVAIVPVKPKSSLWDSDWVCLYSPRFREKTTEIWKKLLLMPSLVFSGSVLQCVGVGFRVTAHSRLYLKGVGCFFDTLPALPSSQCDPLSLLKPSNATAYDRSSDTDLHLWFKCQESSPILTCTVVILLSDC